MTAHVLALSDADATRLYPELAGLITLREAGWRFLPVVTDAGEPVELDGFRAWQGGVTDGLRIYSSTNVLGIRTLPTEPPTLSWERTGTLTQIVGELLALPAPGDRLAPTLVVASAPSLAYRPEHAARLGGAA
jgi:hypothetical protein